MNSINLELPFSSSLSFVDVYLSTEYMLFRPNKIICLYGGLLPILRAVVSNLLVYTTRRTLKEKLVLSHRPLPDIFGAKI